MLRKLKLPVSVNETVSFFTLNGQGPFHIKLEQFDISDNRLKWSFRSSEGHTIMAHGVRHQVALPFFKDAWVCVSIPLHMHVGADTLRADFIFMVPASVTLECNHASARGVI